MCGLLQRTFLEKFGCKRVTTIAVAFQYQDLTIKTSSLYTNPCCNHHLLHATDQSLTSPLSTSNKFLEESKICKLETIFFCAQHNFFLKFPEISPNSLNPSFNAFVTHVNLRPFFLDYSRSAENILTHIHKLLYFSLYKCTDSKLNNIQLCKLSSFRKIMIQEWI